MVRVIPTTSVNKSEYKNYWKKSVEFRNTMRQEIELKRWNSAGLAAVHAGISANDAILVFISGERSISSKHQDTIKLLRTLVKTQGVDEASKHLAKLIYAKNTIEYESRLFRQDEAYAIIKHTERFLDWVESVLPK